MVEAIRNPPGRSVRIAVVGKYTDHVDSYKSVQEALIHGGIENNIAVNIDWISSERFDREADPGSRLDRYDGILIPGGFGPRGVEGMLRTICWAREVRRPFFGICLGLQCAVIEVARDVTGLQEANSLEFDSESPDPVICLMDSQRQVTDKGGPCALARIRRGSSPAPRWRRSRA